MRFIEDPPTDERRRFGLAVGLGLALGLGFLAKYAMVYFLLGVAACAGVVPRARARLSADRLALLLAAALAAILITPNIMWNAAHEFQTLSHTAANANWSADLFHPGELGEFLLGHLGVAGLAALALKRRRIFGGASHS